MWTVIKLNRVACIEVGGNLPRESVWLGISRWIWFYTCLSGSGVLHIPMLWTEKWWNLEVGEHGERASCTPLHDFGGNWDFDSWSLHESCPPRDLCLIHLLAPRVVPACLAAHAGHFKVTTSRPIPVTRSTSAQTGRCAETRPGQWLNGRGSRYAACGGGTGHLTMSPEHGTMRRCENERLFLVLLHIPCNLRTAAAASGTGATAVRCAPCSYTQEQVIW